MIFECHYCPKQSASFSEAAKHFEEKHRKGEVIVIPISVDMIKPNKEDKER